jgi:glycosyltransferase involved in cell wall biosynthesis
MTDAPRVTIVTPSYNQALYLEATIQSVLAQAYSNLEYIIIDGGSTDGSVDIIRKYERHLAYWISEPDRGQSDAINKGFRRATGTYLNWLNSDDVLLPHALQTLVEFLDCHPDIACVFGNTVFIAPDGSELFRRRDIPFHAGIVTYAFNYLPQPAALFRAQVLKRVGMLDERLHYCMDHELWLRMHGAGYAFGKVNDFIAGYRFHLESKGIRNSDRINAERLGLKGSFGMRFSSSIVESFLFGFLDLWYRALRMSIRLRHYGIAEIIPGRLRLAILMRQGRLKNRDGGQSA